MLSDCTEQLQSLEFTVSSCHSSSPLRRCFLVARWYVRASPPTTQSSGSMFSFRGDSILVALNTLGNHRYWLHFINGEMKAHRVSMTCEGHTLNPQQRQKKLERLLRPHLEPFNSLEPLRWLEGLADFKDQWPFGIAPGNETYRLKFLGVWLLGSMVQAQNMCGESLYCLRWEQQKMERWRRKGGLGGGKKTLRALHTARALSLPHAVD